MVRIYFVQKFDSVQDSNRPRFLYCLILSLVSVGYARITHAGLTDTEIQMAKFRLPSSKSFEDNQRIVTDPSQVDDPSILFNPK